MFSILNYDVIARWYNCSKHHNFPWFICFIYQRFLFRVWKWHSQYQHHYRSCSRCFSWNFTVCDRRHHILLSSEKNKVCWHHLMICWSLNGCHSTFARLVFCVLICMLFCVNLTTFLCFDFVGKKSTCIRNITRLETCRQAPTPL